jgi:tRNA pseudouridine38-40 synthase
VRTIRLLLEYDGTGYAGWQIQSGDGAPRTIQGELESALFRMTGEAIRARAASRTDAGVHARGQVVAFETGRDRIPPIGFVRGLNAHLPPSIVVRRASEASAGYEPRRSSRGKRYRYTFWNDPEPSALDRRSAWFVRPRLELEPMRRAAEALLGSHDFEAFRSAGCSAKHAHRTLYEVSIAPGAYARLELVIVGNAFCRNMVRIIAGTLREVGLGKIDPGAIPAILESRERARAGMTAPAHGLCLEEVIEDERLPPRPDKARMDPGGDVDDEE